MSEREARKKENVLFNDALNTLYLPLYGIGHIVKGHSDSERGKLQGCVFLVSSKGSFIYMQHSINRIVHTILLLIHFVVKYLNK